MTYPNFKNKHLEESLFLPSDFMAYRKKDAKKYPKKYILTFQFSALNYFKRKWRGKYHLNKEKIAGRLLVTKDFGFVKMAGIGAPHAAVAMEELIELGGREFIIIGTAGGLEDFGIFLCEKAVRDEGTSHHYLPASKFAYPNKKFTNTFKKFLKEEGITFQKAPTWTIDAPYRETKKEVKKYRKEGVKTVEMEAAALFAVAKVRKVKVAAAFAVSDVLGKKWNPQFDKKQNKRNLHSLIDAAIKCLEKK